MAKYTAIAKNNGTFEVQKLTDIIFDKVSSLKATAQTGADYWNPNTQKSSQLTGAVKYESITAEVLLSKVQYESTFIPWMQSAEAIDGSLVATHLIGDIRSSLSGIRYSGHEMGEIDKLSNDACKLIVTFTYEGYTTNKTPAQVLGITIPTFG